MPAPCALAGPIFSATDHFFQCAMWSARTNFSGPRTKTFGGPKFPSILPDSTHSDCWVMDALADYGSSGESEREEKDSEDTNWGKRKIYTRVNDKQQVHSKEAWKIESAVTARPPVRAEATAGERSKVLMPQSRVYVSRRRGKYSESVTTDPEITGTASKIGDDLSLYLPSRENVGRRGRKQVRMSNVPPKFNEKLPTEHSRPVVSLNWHGNNSAVLLSCSLDGTCKLWDSLHKKCLTTMLQHGGAAISSAQWVSYNTVVTGGFDSLICLSDMEKGQIISSLHHKDFVSVVHMHPTDNNLVFSGDYGANIYSWDLRAGKAIKNYVGAGGKILDMIFLREGHEMVASSDVVRKNASSQALRVWEVDSAVVLSSQVYMEPYTCPSLQAHPFKQEFYAQSNANYIVVFSSRRPYKCNKHRRYETHRVDGNKVQFDVSPDGTLLCSASADGRVVVYDCNTSIPLKTLNVSKSTCCAVSWNKHMPSTVAVSDWNSNISILT